MAKKFTIKKNRLRSRSSRRRWALKVDAPVPQRKPTLQEANRDVIAAIAAKINAGK